MKLFNKTIDRQLFKQYSLGSDLSKQEVVVKIFNPYGNGRWYILNSDPQDPDYLWAIVDLGYGAEVGSVSRSELENYRGKFGLGFERDLGFDAMNAEEFYKKLRNKEQFAEGGEVSFIDYKDSEIMYEPIYNKYYANDVEFDTLKQAQAFIDSGEVSPDIRDAYSKGLFANGGSLEEVLSQDVTFLKFDSHRAYDSFKKLDIPHLQVHDYDFNHYSIIKTENLNKVLDYVKKGIRVVKKKFTQDDLGFDYKGRMSFEEGGNLESFSDNQRMIMNQNVEVEHHHEELEDILEDEVPVPAWVVAKMETATQNLSDITHYLDGQKEITEDQLEEEEDEMEMSEIENKEVIEPINVSAGTKAELTKKFTDDALGNLKGFLKGMEGIELRDDYTFDYKNEQYEVEPIINSDENSVSNAVFTIFNGDAEEVGEIAYSREGGKQKFTANSEFFSWNDAKFEDGGFMNNVYADGGRVYDGVVDYKKASKLLMQYKPEILYYSDGYVFVDGIGLSLGSLTNQFKGYGDSTDIKNLIYKVTHAPFDKAKVNIEKFTKGEYTLTKGGYGNQQHFLKTTKKMSDGGYFDGTIPNVSAYMSNYADGGGLEKVKWQEVEIGDSARVKEINRMGLIVKTYGRKFHLKFPNGTEKTFDATELDFFKLEKDQYEMDDNNNFAKGGEVAKAEILGLKRNIMGTTDIEMKISGMRKPQSFIVYPISADDTDKIIKIQSSTRIGQLDLKTGRGLMSQSHSNGAYFVHFQMDTLTPFAVSESDLEDIKAYVFKTAGSNVGTRGIVSDNSGASGVYAKGGVTYYNDENQHRLGRASGSFEKEIFEKVKDRIHSESFVGNFGWKTPQGKRADGYLYKLDGFDKGLIKDLKLKQGEVVFRYVNRTTAIGGSTPFIKINIEKELLYFPVFNDNDDIIFETRGVTPLWISLIEGSFAHGGETEEGVDLFEDYENIPDDLQEILDNYQDAFEEGDYDGLEKALKEANAIGYTFEYYLNGQAYDLRKIGQKGKSEVEEYAKAGNIYPKYVKVEKKDVSKFKQILNETGIKSPYSEDISDKQFNIEQIAFYFKDEDDRQKAFESYHKSYAKGGNIKKYILKADIKTVTVKRKGKQVTYNGSDVLNGAHVLAKGGDITSKANYVGKNDVVEVELKDGSKVKPANGYWIKKGAEPISNEPTPNTSVKSEPKLGQTYIRKDARNNWEAETTVDDFNGYDWRLSTIKTYSGKLISSAQGGKTEETGSKGIVMFKYTMYEDPNYTLEVSIPKRLSEKLVTEQHEKALAKFKKFMETGMFKGGGKISNFDKLSNKVAKEYEGKLVKSQYQEEYGKYYSEEEAQEVGDKVAGKMKAMTADKKAFGGLFSGAKKLISTKKYPQLQGKQVFLKSGEMVHVFEQSEDSLSVLELNKFESGERPHEVKIYDIDPTSYEAGGKTETKKENGGRISMKLANDLAKEIRKDGESWNDAKKRAFAQLKK